jgi:eukaryotic-like serine/threonine-protein kinase
MPAKVDVNIRGVTADKGAPFANAGQSSRPADTIVVADTSISLGSPLDREIDLALSHPARAHGPAEGERYALVSEIGRGGMGRVDLIFDRVLGRTVARKSSLARDRHAEYLVAEAQICAQLEHPAIVPVYDLAFEDDVEPSYTMRVVKGRTLRAILDDDAEERRTPFAQVLGVLRQVCLAVDYAHSRGVVHRDLKPENVVVGEFGEVYVLDWGVALVEEHSELRGTLPTGDVPLSVAGSPGYMSPEQALGERIDARTDVFALGAMLFEIVAGARLFDDDSLSSILKRLHAPVTVLPSQRARRAPAVSAFDGLVVACLAPNRDDRPPSARFVADAIDTFLDGERARAEREREAARHAAEGEAAREAFEALDAQAAELRERAEELLSELEPHRPIEDKQPAWEMLERARGLASEAARALARAEAAFTRALGHVAEHPAARAGMAKIQYRQFVEAEAAGERERMARTLELARAYDDGALRLELADTGTLEVVTTPAIDVSVERYQEQGLLLRTVDPRIVAAGARIVLELETGAYLCRARREGVESVYPLKIARAHCHVLHWSLESARAVPEGMAWIAGGPFLATRPRSTRLKSENLPDFAISIYPVTCRDYARFLDELDGEEQRARIPASKLGGPILEKDEPDGWRLGAQTIEGPASRRLTRGGALDVPVYAVSWYDASAYVAWLSKKTGRSFRLPTDLEWEKAMRGADGRNFPMGNHLDPAFAKLRESRPEAAQPEVVGAFPLDASPYGVRDLAGGMGDWTSTMVDGEPPPSLAHERADAADRQAYWRGGTWGTTAVAPRALRYTQLLRHRTGNVGFRLALSLDVPPSSLDVTPLPR